MKLEDEIQQKNFKNDYQRAAINIIYTNNWLLQIHEAALKPYQITVQQFNILRILRGQHPKPASIKLLKERMLDKMSDVSRLVEKLRVKGFLERTTCPSDRRNVDVAITLQGLEVLKKLDHYDDDFKKLFGKLSKDEIKKLSDLLDKIRG